MFELVAKSKSEIDLMLYGTIAEWDKVNAHDFSRAMNTAVQDGATTINFRIHSPGGNPFEGIAMGTKINEVRMRGIKTVAVIEGLAASMMSALVCFCDKVIIAKHARMMVHQSKGVAIGSAAQLITYGKMMQTMNATLAEIYAQKTGKDEKWILENWMAEGKDQWFTAEEAVSNQLVDEISGEPSKVKALAAQGGTYFQMAAHYDQFFKDTNDTIMKKEELIALLGLKTEATEAEISAALKAMKDKADKKETSAGGDPIANVLAIAKERGVTDEKQIAAIKKLAAVDVQSALDMLPAKAEEKKEGEKKESPAPLALADVITALKGDGTEAKSDKRNWDWNDWSKHPKEFEALLKEKPKEYIRLFKAEFDYEPSEDELKSVVFKR